MARSGLRLTGATGRIGTLPGISILTGSGQRLRLLRSTRLRLAAALGIVDVLPVSRGCTISKASRRLGLGEALLDHPHFE